MEATGANKLFNPPVVVELGAGVAAVVEAEVVAEGDVGADAAKMAGEIPDNNINDEIANFFIKPS